ncbi:MAG: hypothetical protein JSU06_12310 [Actinobacteria bacterium]|nr:hypothetical protein [Actinomycetota bacterium]
MKLRIPKLRRPSVPPEQRIPRGAVVVVLVGLVATLAAALLATEKGGGEAANLEFVQQRKIPDSKPVGIPGAAKFHMQLVENKVQSTGTNVAGYALFRVIAVLKIDQGAPLSGGRLVCSVHAPRTGTLIAQSSGGLRATYPRSNESGIYGQEMSETVLIQFASHSSELAVLEVKDLKQPRWASIQGVKLQWPEYEEGTEHLDYTLPQGKAKAAVELPFFTIWKSKKPPAAQVACRLQVPAGKATVETEGSLPRMAPPINEEAEAEAQKEREESGEAAGEAAKEGK